MSNLGSGQVNRGLYFIIRPKCPESLFCRGKKGRENKKGERSYREGRKAQEKEERERRGKLRQKVGGTAAGRLGRRWGAATSQRPGRGRAKPGWGEVTGDPGKHRDHSLSKKVPRGTDL